MHRRLTAGEIIPIDKKGDRKECINYRDISLVGFSRKVCAKCFEEKLRDN